MKKDKNSLKQKIVIAIACLVIVACTISMTTMAWFTDTMQGTTNLTFGKIKLSDDYTEYTFNTPEAPAVASRKINDGDWAIVLDETSNDAFIRLIAKYGAPIKYVPTTDATYLPNKAYYKVVSTNYVKMVAAAGTSVGAGEDYVVGDDVSGTVYECNYSLDYITSESAAYGQPETNLTLDLIDSETYFAQYYAVTSVLGTTFLKGVKYYAFIDGEFKALIGSTTYDANTDYFYGQAYTEFGHEEDQDNDPATPAVFVADTVYVGYNYVSGSNATYKIVPNDIALTEDETYQNGKTYYNNLGIELSVTVGNEITGSVYEATSTYFKLVEATDTEGTINIAANSVIGTTTNAVSGKMYRTTIYNAYIDWLIENVTLPGTPEAVGNYFTEVDTSGETPVGKESSKGTYAFIKSTGTNQGTAEYYLASDLLGTALNAVRTEVIDENTGSVTNRYVFAEDGDIKIKDSADQITLKSATLTQIGTAKADVTTYLGNVNHNDATKVLAYDGTHYTVYDSNVNYAAEGITFYYYSGDVTVINGHAYFFEVAANATPLVLKYAQKDLGLGLSIDIQAIQTILSRKATADDVTAGLATAAGDKLTIAIMTVADSHTVTHDNEDDSLAGKLGAYKNGEIVRVATIADIAPYFVAQFGAAN